MYSYYVIESPNFYVLVNDWALTGLLYIIVVYCCVVETGWRPSPEDKIGSY